MKTRTTTAIVAALLMAANMEMTMAQAQTQVQTQAQQAPSTLPGGASSLNETYQDWTVVCTSGEQGRICVMSQQQRKSDTGQLVLAAELGAVPGGEVRGSLVLPFGLRLADGLTLQIDDGPASQPLPFSTCLPAGCIVQVSFDAATVKALRAAAAVKLVAKAHDGGGDVLLGLSLKGFSAAHDRAVSLSQ